MSGEDTYDPTESDQETAGDMGVSSEREGPTGPGQHATTGVRDTRGTEAAPNGQDDEPPPEQSTGGTETNPEGLTPKAGYSSADPRSDD